jgi:hypothetical protein
MLHEITGCISNRPAFSGQKVQDFSVYLVHERLTVMTETIYGVNGWTV